MQIAIVPAVPPEQRVQDGAGWKKLGAELLGYAKRATEQGFTFAWHNHHFEFARLPDGSMPLEWILGEDPVLKWQVDIAWVIRGEQDPKQWIERYGARVVGFHVKDLAPEGQNADEDGWADVGHGRLDWSSLLPVMRATPATIWTLEHDNPKDDARFARRSFATVSVVVSGMRELGVGIVGCGVISTIYMQNMPLFAGVKLVACADMRPEAAKAQAQQIRHRCAAGR